jgi:hypothetical protein
MCNRCKPNNRKIDNCMMLLVTQLKELGIETLGSCCGHGKYPPSLVYRFKREWKDCRNGNIYDYFSGWGIPRKSRFYLKDKQGYYYIPEVINELI